MTSAMAEDLAPLLERCFLFDATEDSYNVTTISGRVPSWLRGTYYVNGPSRFLRGGRRYNHWLDGDGMVHGLTFSPEGVRARCRFVQTQKLRDEEKAGAFLYRAFGTAFPQDRLRRNVMLEGPVNVSVYMHGGKLLAGGEQTLPMELDAESLETRGEFDFNGGLNEVTPFSAHAKIDPVNGHLLNFGIQFAAANPTLMTYEFDAAGELVRRRRHAIGHQHSQHDFGYTKDFFVFYLSPMIMDFGRFVNEGVSVADSISWEPEKGSTLFLAPRGKGEGFSIPIEPRYCLHFINCFQTADAITVDVLELDRPVYPEYRPIPDLFANVPPCRPVRYVVDLATHTVREQIRLDCDWSPDFPSINPANSGNANDAFWAMGIGAAGKPGRKFFDTVFRGSFTEGGIRDSYRSPAGEYLGGEPVCVVNPRDRDEAIVVAQWLKPATGEAAHLLFDAWNLKSGPVAKIHSRHFIHPGFHTTFIPHVA